MHLPLTVPAPRRTFPPLLHISNTGLATRITGGQTAPQCGFLLSVKHGTLSMGATCGSPSGLPEPVTGSPTRTFALTPFGDGARDSQHLTGITMKTRTLGAPASTRLSVYRFVRHFAGPVTAIRLARFFSRSVA